MTIDLTKKTFVLGSQLDELGIINFDKFNGHDFSFEYDGIIYTGRKINRYAGKVVKGEGEEKYRILSRRKNNGHKQSL